MLNLPGKRFLTQTLIWFLSVRVVFADGFPGFMESMDSEYCSIFQPLDTSDVSMQCSSGFISSSSVEGVVLVQIGLRTQEGTSYRFSRSIDEVLSKYRFDSLRKVSEMCLNLTECSRTAALTMNNTFGQQEWHCGGRYMTVELEQVWVLLGEVVPMGNFRNVYFCLNDHQIHGIITPLFDMQRIRSRPEVNLNDHLFLYFEMPAT